jgi:hypothetical protein
MRNQNRFSALVTGVVGSKPFQMNMKVTEPVPSHTVDNASPERGKGAK